MDPNNPPPPLRSSPLKAAPLILVDCREPLDCLPPLLEKYGFKSETKQLPLGDYLVDNTFLFERKTLLDLVTSIKDGRIFSQVCRLADSDYHPCIILEGTANSLRNSKMRREAIQGVLIQISLFLNIPVLRSMNLEETVQLMALTSGQLTKHQTDGHYRHGYRPKGKRRRQLFILQGFPGIGAEKAKLLLDHFGSIESIITATPEALQTVDTIGPKIADKIRYYVSETQIQYKI